MVQLIYSENDLTSFKFSKINSKLVSLLESVPGIDIDDITEIIFHKPVFYTAHLSVVLTQVKKLQDVDDRIFYLNSILFRL